MSETIQNALFDLRNYLAWAPDVLVAAFIMALAAVIAVSLHSTAVRLVRRILGDRRPFLRSLIASTKGVSRLALLILGLSIALPTAPFDSATSNVIAKILLVATIALFGWIALVAVNMAADLYLARFRIDVEDNLLARKHVTQVRILRRAADTLVVVVTAGAALMTFESVRQYGVSLFASAGVAGLVAGLAARPLLSNLFAGVQLAMTQPIRIDDAVIVENEYGWIEEITSTYVVIRLWDWRRLVVPLAYFIERPFQNWTREGSALIGSVLLYLDYAAPIGRIRAKAQEIAEQSRLWDGKVVNVQVTDAKDNVIEVRVLISARSASTAWDLRCDVREKLIDFLQRECPAALPRGRREVVNWPDNAAAEASVRRPQVSAQRHA